jgi:hypothetical protein
MNEFVRLPGIIIGDGGHAECTVKALKVTNPGGGAVAFTHFTVERVSSVLPPGQYQLTCNGVTEHVRYDGQHWLARGW